VLTEAIAAVLHAPTPAALRRLQAELLELGTPSDAAVWPILGQLHHFLDQVATTSTSRQYSDLASKMDIGALASLIIEDLMTADSGTELADRLAAGALTEGLAVLATRQHVKAWESGLSALYRETAWFLYQQLWYWAEIRKPELEASERRRLIDTLLAPVWAAETPGEHKVLLLVRLLQVLLTDALLGLARISGD